MTKCCCHNKKTAVNNNVHSGSGDPAEIRTPDTLLKRQVLCQLSYWVIYEVEKAERMRSL